jgi:hypothetical protein
MYKYFFCIKVRYSREYPGINVAPPITFIMLRLTLQLSYIEKFKKNIYSSGQASARTSSPRPVYRRRAPRLLDPFRTPHSLGFCAAPPSHPSPRAQIVQTSPASRRGDTEAGEQKARREIQHPIYFKTSKWNICNIHLKTVETLATNINYKNTWKRLKSHRKIYATST